jgi:hypothetical protein
MTQRNTYGASWSSTYRCDLTPHGDVDRLALRARAAGASGQAEWAALGDQR